MAKVSSPEFNDCGSNLRSLNVPKEELAGLDQVFKIKINPYYLSLIKAKGDPIYKQVVRIRPN
jgi:L-lysine 2,3-aminomutase